MHHLCEPKDLSGCDDITFLFIRKGYHCTIANAFISSVSNFSNTIMYFSKLVKTFDMYCKLEIGYSTIQATFADKNFGSDLKDARRVFSKHDEIMNYHQTIVEVS